MNANLERSAMKSATRLTGTITAAFLAAATLVLTGGSAFAQQTSTASSAPQELRNYRYCEVIPSVQSGSTVTSYIYNTTGFNHCPPGKWAKLTQQEVNDEFGSQKAQLNGPRHWVLDRIESTGPQTGTGKTFTFGGIEMGLDGTLTTQAGQPTVGEQPYVINEVNRDTIWTYDPGKPIFELTDPDGHVYVMQSYSQLVDKNLTYRDLPGLGCLLTLPPGWSYSWKKLTQTLNLNSNGLAYIVNDNLFDTYQRIS